VSIPITFKGRLGGDPELTTSSNGSAICKMRVVTNRRRIVDGDWQDTDTSWWQVTAFGKAAEAAAEQLHKGDLVMVEGRVKQREWEKDGVKRTTAEVTADEVAKVCKAGWKAPAQEGSADPWATETAPF
jgi:single-strand DNA-binding protein